MPKRRSSKKHHRRHRRSMTKKMMKKNLLLIKGGSSPLNMSEYQVADANVGAAAHAIKTFGAADSQHAATGSNVIAMKGGNGHDVAVPDVVKTATGGEPLTIKGGNPPELVVGSGDGDAEGVVEGERMGGEGAAGLAVPAVLLVASQMMSKRRRSGKKHRRSHRRRYSKK